LPLIGTPVIDRKGLDPVDRRACRERQLLSTAAVGRIGRELVLCGLSRRSTLSREWLVSAVRGLGERRPSS
jgi:hypothetical protein